MAVGPALVRQFPPLSWHAKQAQTTLPPEHTLFIAACLASALDYLHARLVVYRDLKPRNVLFDGRGYPRLIDFTRCKQLEQTNARFEALLVQSGMERRARMLMNKAFTLLGCADRRDVCYRAPEFVSGRGHDTAADLWSLGAVLYELHLGHAPFDVLQQRHQDHLLNICPLSKTKRLSTTGVRLATAANKVVADMKSTLVEAASPVASSAAVAGDEASAAHGSRDGDEFDDDQVSELMVRSAAKGRPPLPSPADLADKTMSYLEEMDAYARPKPRQLFYAMITSPDYMGELASVQPEAARTLIDSLLQMEPDQRWGSSASKRRLSDHAYFKDIDKEAIDEGTYCPPRPERYTSKLVDPNFDVSTLFRRFDGNQQNFFGFRD